MNFETIGELHEIIVNVRLTDSNVPVVSSSRGHKFSPETIHSLWIRETDGTWDMVYVELKGTLPKSGRKVSKTYWSAIRNIPEWIGEIVEKTTPKEARREVTGNAEDSLHK